MNLDELTKFIPKEDYPKINKDISIENNVIPMIIEAYSGNRGEFTATSQYSYQSFLLKPTKELYHKVIELISVNEMRHLEILSQILIYSNVDPKFCRYIDNNANLPVCWSGSNVNYEKDIKTFLENNIRAEERAIEHYKMIISRTNSENLKNIIERIIKDEQAHIRIFRTLIENL